MRKWKAYAVAIVATALLLSALAPSLADTEVPETDEDWAHFLIGSWHADNAVGSGYAERFVFRISIYPA